MNPTCRTVADVRALECDPQLSMIQIENRDEVRASVAAGRVAAFAEYRANVDSGRYPQPDHVVPVADGVYGQFVEYLDSVV